MENNLPYQQVYNQNMHTNKNDKSGVNSNYGFYNSQQQ